MRLGALFPQPEFRGDPIAIRDFAQGVEAIGFDHLLMFEHVLGASPENREAEWTGPYTHEHQFHEPFVLFGYLAGFTRSIELVTDILVLPQRQTALVAKQAAEVDVLTGGRLRVGTGVGWNSVEMEALGQDFHTRGARMAEQIAVLRALWTQELVTFHGRWHHLDNVGLNPLPVRRPIPIWMGGESEGAVRRAGRLADGYIPGGGMTTPYHRHQAGADGWGPTIERMRQAARDAGRDPSTIGIEGSIWLSRRPTPDDWVAAAEEWRSLGATHIYANSMYIGLKTPDEHIETLRRFHDALSAAVAA
jgi:probable F420-dependent oxidoreductase